VVGTNNWKKEVEFVAKPKQKAKARHILVETKEECEALKQRIQAGENFEKLAEGYSKCPSGKNGGYLGEFMPGQMVEEFDKVVFTKAVGKVHGPIKTQFGYHLIYIMERMG
jgi:peptidyl-prolyl cis-trans isomerase C